MRAQFTVLTHQLNTVKHHIYNTNINKTPSTTNCQLKRPEEGNSLNKQTGQKVTFAFQNETKPSILYFITETITCVST